MRDLIDRFHMLVRKRMASGLEQWLADAEANLIASFTNSRFAANGCAISEPAYPAAPSHG
jgi:hypothetical protein